MMRTIISPSNDKNNIRPNQDKSYFKYTIPKPTNIIKTNNTIVESNAVNIIFASTNLRHTPRNMPCITLNMVNRDTRSLKVKSNDVISIINPIAIAKNANTVVKERLEMLFSFDSFLLVL